MDHQHRHSTEQQEAEAAIRQALQEHLKQNADITFGANPKEWGVKLDAYCDDPLILVEIWARRGKAKSAQKHKAVTDLCKLVWAEKLAGGNARKIFAVSCDEAVSFLRGKSWAGAFAKAHGIEIVTLDIAPEVVKQVLEAQKRQGWEQDL